MSPICEDEATFVHSKIVKVHEEIAIKSDLGVTTGVDTVELMPLLQLPLSPSWGDFDSSPASGLPGYRIAACIYPDSAIGAQAPMPRSMATIHVRSTLPAAGVISARSISSRRVAGAARLAEYPWLLRPITMAAAS